MSDNTTRRKGREDTYLPDNSTPKHGELVAGDEIIIKQVILKEGVTQRLSANHHPPSVRHTPPKSYLCPKTEECRASFVHELSSSVPIAAQRWT